MNARNLVKNEDLPWVLVSGPEWVGLEHPRVVELALASDPHGPALGRVVVFREEDYFERGEDGWIYTGLLPLELADGDDRPDEEREPNGAREGELSPEESFFGRQFTWPDQVPCPACPGEAQVAPDYVQEECAGFICPDCEASLFAERRENLLNAAVLFLLGDEVPATESQRRDAR